MSAEVSRELFDERVLARWLAPDAELDTLDAAALTWLEARVEEHRDAASRAGACARWATPRVAVTRSLPDALDATEAAWARAPAPDAHLAALYAAWGAAWSRVKQPGASVFSWPAYDLAPLVTWWVRHGRSASGLAAVLPMEVLQARGCHPVDHPRCPPGVILAVWETMHRRVYADGAASPSPWRPLLEVWNRGAWPLLLPGGAVLVWVPVRREDALVFDPRRPTPPGAPLDALHAMRRPVAAATTTRLPTLRALGLGLLSTRPGAGLPSNVYPAGPLLITGAVPAAGPLPVPAPDEPDPYGRLG